MPYSQQHKALTRARIVESARVMFNRRGFEQVMNLRGGMLAVRAQEGVRAN